LLQNSVENQIWWLPTTNSIPIVERVCKTDSVCGKISSETKNLQTLFFLVSWYEHQIVMPLLQQQQYFHQVRGICDFHSG
jgi:hypothetical protein